MNTRTKQTNIDSKTKKIVHDRDGGYCIICGTPVDWAFSNAHIVPRSKGGLGVEENIVTLCMQCHHELDQTTKGKELMKYVKKYIKSFYPDWNEEELKYKKGMDYVKK